MKMMVENETGLWLMKLVSVLELQQELSWAKMVIENEAMELLAAELYWAKMMVENEMVVPLEVRVMGSWLELELELSWAKMVVENEMELSLTGRVLGI